MWMELGTLYRVPHCFLCKCCLINWSGWWDGIRWNGLHALKHSEDGLYLRLALHCRYFRVSINEEKKFSKLLASLYAHPAYLQTFMMYGEIDRIWGKKLFSRSAMQPLMIDGCLSSISEQKSKKYFRLIQIYSVCSILKGQFFSFTRMIIRLFSS